MIYSKEFFQKACLDDATKDPYSKKTKEKDKSPFLRWAIAKYVHTGQIPDLYDDTSGFYADDVQKGLEDWIMTHDPKLRVSARRRQQKEHRCFQDHGSEGRLNPVADRKNNRIKRKKFDARRYSSYCEAKWQVHIETKGDNTCYDWGYMPVLRGELKTNPANQPYSDFDPGRPINPRFDSRMSKPPIPGKTGSDHERVHMMRYGNGKSHTVRIFG